MNEKIPRKLKEILPLEIWQSWSEEQRNYIKKTQGKSIGKVILGETDPRWYSGKKWEFDQARPQYNESCPECKFPYCFYAMPRNWSMRSSSDVWNLMKCAKVECQRYFESCL